MPDESLTRESLSTDRRGLRTRRVTGTFLHRQGIDAVTQATGLRTIGEDMPLVSPASIAGNLNTSHAMRLIQVVSDGILLYWLGKRGPPGTTVELSRGIKQRSIAANTGIAARCEELAHVRAEGSFRSLEPGDLKLFGSQLITPFFIRFPYHTIRFGIPVLGIVKHIIPG